MIDYEKIKLAHELCINLNNYCVEMVLGINGTPTLFLRYTDENGDNSKITFMKSIDDLITKLQELTQPKPKYEVGQEVWRLNDNYQYISFIINDFQKDTFNKNYYVYKDEYGCWYFENQLYPSQEALIDAQIEYWQSLKKECEHESDGKQYRSLA